ncbi:MAG: hypothetical protein S4CHLAM6_15380 [Chlamydiae bacterium]|nr:hypothetical protein [Chlamydiota bacterium]
MNYYLSNVYSSLATNFGSSSIGGMFSNFSPLVECAIEALFTTKQVSTKQDDFSEGSIAHDLQINIPVVIKCPAIGRAWKITQEFFGATVSEEKKPERSSLFSIISTELSQCLHRIYDKSPYQLKGISKQISSLYNLLPSQPKLLFGIQGNSSIEEKISKKLVQLQKSCFAPGKFKETNLISKAMEESFVVSDKLLLHVLGDSFGTDSGLEGMSAFQKYNWDKESTSSGHLMNFLELQQKIKNSHYPAAMLLKSVREAVEFSKEFYKKRPSLCKRLKGEDSPSCFNDRSKKEMQSLSATMRSKLQSMQPGTAFHMFGGWAGHDSSSGHALLYRFSKQADGLFSFEIINTGSGLSNHLHHHDNGILKTVFNRGKKNVSLEDLTSQAFVTALYEIYARKQNYDANFEITIAWDVDHIYQFLSERVLTGDDFVGDISEKDWMQPQFSGTCAYRSLLQMYNKDITEKQKFRLELELGIWTLKNHLSSLNFSRAKEFTIDLIRKSISAYSKQLTHSLKKYPKLFNLEELTQITSYLEAGKAVVSALREQFKLLSMNIEGSLSLYKKAIGVVIPPNALDQEIMQLETGTVSYESISFGFAYNFSIVDRLDSDNWTQELSGVVEHLKQASEMDLHSYVNQLMFDLTAKLKSIDFSGLDISQRHQAINGIHLLTKEFYKSRALMESGEKIFAKSYLTMLRSNLMIHRLMNPKMAQELGFDYPLKFLFPSLDVTDSILFSYSSPEDLDEIQSIQSELKEQEIQSKYDDKAIFGFIESGGAYLVHFVNELKLNDKLSFLKDSESATFLRDVFVKSLFKLLGKKNLEREPDAKPMYETVGEWIVNLKGDFSAKNTQIAELPELWYQLISQSSMLDFFSRGLLSIDDAEIIDQDTCLFTIEAEKKNTFNGSPEYTIRLGDEKRASEDFKALNAKHSLKTIASKAREKLNSIDFSTMYMKKFPFLLLQTHVDLQSIGMLDDLSSKGSSVISESFSKGVGALHAPPIERSKQNSKRLGGTFYEKIQSEEGHPHQSYMMGKPQDANRILNEIDHLMLLEPEVRINRILDYYLKPHNIDSLNSYVGQLGFYASLFSDSSIKDALLVPVDGQIFRKKLLGSLEKMFRHSFYKKEYRTQIFLLRIYNMLSRFTDYYLKDSPDSYEGLSVESHLQRLLQAKELDEVDRCHVLGESLLYAINQKGERLEDLQEVLELSLKYKKAHENYIQKIRKRNFSSTGHGLIFYEQSEEVSFRFKRHLNKHKKLIIENATPIFNFLASSIGYQVGPEDTWKVDENLSFPNFICDSKNIHLDLFKAEFSRFGFKDIFPQFPSFCTQSRQYQEVFKDRNFHLTSIGESRYQFKDTNENLYEVEIGLSEAQSCKLNFKRWFKGELFQILPKTLVEGLVVDGLYKNVHLISGFNYWISKDHKIILSSKETLKDHYVYDPKVHRGLTCVETGQILVDVLSTPLSFLKYFELPEAINLRVSPVLETEDSSLDKLELLEFPRLIAHDGDPLAFTKQGDRLLCKNYPGLFLSSKRDLFGARSSNIVTLEDSEGRLKLALMSPYKLTSKPLEHELNPSFSENLALDQKSEEHDLKQPLFVYQVASNKFATSANAQLSYTLKAQSRSADIYLAYHYLIKHNYSEAYKVLSHLKSYAQHLNSEEISWIKEIVNSVDSSKDNYAESVAVRTLALYIAVEQISSGCRAFNSVADEEFLEKIASLYQQYINLQSYHSDLSLSSHEELLILEFLARQNSSISRIALSSRREEKLKELGFSASFKGKELSKKSPQHSKVELEELKDSSFDNIDFFIQEKSERSYRSLLESSDFLGTFLTPQLNEIDVVFDTLYRAARSGEHLQVDLSAYLMFLGNYKVVGVNADFHKEYVRGMANFIQLVSQYPEKFPVDNPFSKSDAGQRAQDKEFKLKNVVRELINLSKSKQAQGSSDVKKSKVIVNPPLGLSKKTTDLIPKFELPRLEIVDQISVNEPIFKQLLTQCFSADQKEHILKQQCAGGLNFKSSKGMDDFSLRAFHEAQDDLDYYSSLPLKESYSLAQYGLLDHTVKYFGENLVQLSIKQKKLVSKMREKIELLANSDACEASERVKMNLGHISDTKRYISVDDLLGTYLFQDSQKYFEMNPSLGADQITQLNQLITQYLVEATYLQKLNRVKESLAGFFESKKHSMQSAVKKVVELAHLERHYSIKSNPLYLVFEYYSDILLYPKQIEKLALFQQYMKKPKENYDAGLILEAIMGFGKSKVIMPLLALEAAYQKHVPVIVMPENLIESIGDDLTGTLSRFNREVKLLIINRSKEDLLEKLGDMWLLLQKAVANQEAILVSSKSLHTLLLNYIEFLTGLSKKNSKSDQILQLFRDIFSVLRKSSLPIFDEADLLFNCRHETQHATGLFEPLKPTHIDLSTKIYKLIITHQDKLGFNFSFLPDSKERKVLSANDYETIVKPFLARKMIDAFKSEGQFSTLAEKLELNKGTDRGKNNLENLSRYLLGDDSQETRAFFSGIRDDEMANLIALTYAQLNIFLPLTLSKSLKEHYGSPEDRKKGIAIPYQLGKEKTGSEFGNPYETVNYSIQTYLQEGIPHELIEKDLKILVHNILELLMRFPEANIRQFSLFEEIKALYPDVKTLPLTADEIKKVCQDLNSSPDKKLKFINKYLLPNIRNYPQKVSVNAQSFKWLFSKITGFTGTMWNAETFPERIETVPSEGITGNTITQILDKSKKSVAIVENESEAFEKLPDLISDERVKAYIDLSGHFDSYSREFIAQEILKIKSDQGIKGVVYYNEHNEIVVYQSKEEPAVAFDQSSLKNHPEKRFTFYDHQRTTGADIKQAPTSRAVLSFSKHTTWRDLSQAAWRMRGLENGQAVDFVVTNPDKQLILASLKREQSDEISPELLIEYALSHQQQIKARDNLLAQKQKILAVLQEEIFNKIVGSELSVEQTYKVFGTYKDLFVTETSDCPKDQFTFAEVFQDTQKVLYAYIEKLEKKYKPLFILSEWQIIKAKIEQVLNFGDMPLEVKSSEVDQKSATSLEQHLYVEVQQEKEVEQESEKETQKTTSYGASELCRIWDYNWSDKLFSKESGPIDMEMLISGPLAKASKEGFLDLHPANHVEKSFIGKFLSENILFEKLLLNVESSASSQKSANYSLKNLCSGFVYEALCVKTSRGLKFILLDKQSGQEWKQFLAQKHHEGKKATSQPTFLISLHSKEVVATSSAKSDYEMDQMLKSKELMGLKAQAKLALGAIHFSLDEIKALESWVETHQIDKKDLLNYFVEKISLLDERYQDFPGSSLHWFLKGSLKGQIKV